MKICDENGKVLGGTCKNCEWYQARLNEIPSLLGKERWIDHVCTEFNVETNEDDYCSRWEERE